MGKLRISIALVAVFAVAFAGTAVANHVYNDVPTNSVFHDEIAEIGGQACADGFPGGLFKPEDAVKRQQMARFLSRCGGRVAHLTSTGSNMIPNTEQPIGTVDFTARADGFVVVTANGWAETSQLGNCPCDVVWSLDDDIDPMTLAATTTYGTLSNVTGETGNARESMSISYMFPISQGDSASYSAVGRTADANLTNYTFQADITAMFFPFDGATVIN